MELFDKCHSPLGGWWFGKQPHPSCIPMSGRNGHIFHLYLFFFFQSNQLQLFHAFITCAMIRMVSAMCVLLELDYLTASSVCSRIESKTLD